MLNNKPIVKVDSAVHLGHRIDKDFNVKNISLGVSKLINSVHMMISKFGYCTSPVKAKLFRTYCTSYYGCVLLSLNSTHIQRLYVTWRKIIRKIWNVPYNTHCKLLPILMSDHDIQTQLLLRFSKFTSNVFCHNNQLVRMCARLSCHSDTPFASNKRLLAYYVNRNDVLSKSDKNSKFVHDKIVRRNIILDDIIVIGNCIRELCEVRDGILQCDFDSSDILSWCFPMRVLMDCQKMDLIESL